MKPDLVYYGAQAKSAIPHLRESEEILEKGEEADEDKGFDGA